MPIMLSASAPPSGDGRLTFKYDPQNPVPTLGGQNLHIAKGPMDQRPVESRPDVLLFTTEPLPEPVEVTGRITATLFISSDCPDTDFTVKLCDVYPDGKSMLVTDGIQRASLRERFETRQLLEPDEGVQVRRGPVEHVADPQQGTPPADRDFVVQLAALRAERQHRPFTASRQGTARGDQHRPTLGRGAVSRFTAGLSRTRSKRNTPMNP